METLAAQQKAKREAAGQRLGETRAAAGSPSGNIQIILVPIDLSSTSRISLQFAAALASQFGARLIVLHVQEYHMTGSWAADLARTLVSVTHSVRKEFHALVANEVPPTLQTRRLLVAGAPANCIVETARKTRANLIVITSHGRTGWEHARLGSVAEHVVRMAPCPVLVLPIKSAEQILKQK